MKPIFSDSNIQKAFDEQGYVVYPFLNEAEVSALLEFYDSLGLNSLDGFHSSMHLSDVILRQKIDRGIKDIIQEPARRLLPDYEPLFANFIVKEANSSSEVGVHQDWTYVDESKHVSVNFWTPLVATNEENGPLYVLPGSHTLNTPPRYTPFENTAYHEHNDWIKEHGVRIFSKPGESVIYDTRLIHFSFPNQSNQKRVAINFVDIPKTAQAIHLHRNEDRLDCFEVDTEFFNTHKLDTTPHGYPKQGQWRIPPNTIQQEDFEELLQYQM